MPQVPDTEDLDDEKHYVVITKPRPKRKRVTFVKDEELNYMLEDRAGTPHISELRYDEDFFVSMRVEDLELARAAGELLDHDRFRIQAML